MPREEDQLVLGRGEVYFDRFLPGTRIGTGERYIGNTPAFQVARTIERVGRARSYRGRKVETAGHVISESHKVNFTTDSISMENVAEWYGDDQSTSSIIAPVGFITEPFLMRRGRYYQLGSSIEPSGVRGVEGVSLIRGVVEIPMAGNYEVDRAEGRIYVLPAALNLLDNTQVTVRFQYRRQRRLKAVSRPNEIHGALRFRSLNPYGPRKHLFMPFVRLMPRGSIDMKGDEYQQMMFEATAMRLGPNVEQVYIDELLATLNLSDEETILEEGLTFDQFCALEADLDFTINVTMAGRNWTPSPVQAVTVAPVLSGGSLTVEAGTTPITVAPSLSGGLLSVEASNPVAWTTNGNPLRWTLDGDPILWTA